MHSRRPRTIGPGQSTTVVTAAGARAPAAEGSSPSGMPERASPPPRRAGSVDVAVGDEHPRLLEAERALLVQLLHDAVLLVAEDAL